MATLCGGIDLGMLLHIMNDKGLAPDVVSGLLHKQSGFLACRRLVAICVSF